MFKKLKDGSYVLPENSKSNVWIAGSPNELVDALNLDESLQNDPEVRMGFIKITKQDDSSEVELPPGIYRFRNSSYNNPEALVPMEIIDRKYNYFPSIFSSLDEELNWFITNPTFFSDIGIRRSRSVLLWGPPGYSKTAKIHDLVLKQKDAVVIFLTLPPSEEMVQQLNKIKRNKICIFEEFATSVGTDSKISAMLNFLDGDNSMDDVFFIITTNHPEIIPKNILRPSRVDKFIKVDKLSSTDIRHFVKFYLKREASDNEVIQLEHSSLAGLREVCISSLKGGISLGEAAKLLKSREAILKKDFAADKQIGLSNGSIFDDL